MLSHISVANFPGRSGDYLHYFLADATAWFVFISGYLFYYLEINKFFYFSYLKRKWKFVITPYLTLSIPAIAAGLYLGRHIMYDLSVPAYILWALTTGGTMVGPMWFIPMITIFFLLTPLFRLIARSNWIVAVAAIGLIFSLFSFRPYFNTNAIFSFAHFVGFYLLGIAMAKHEDKLKNLSHPWVACIVGISLAIFFLFAYLYPGIDKDQAHFYGTIGSLNHILVGKFSLLVAIFFLFERFVNYQQDGLAFLAKISFGLFFIHGFMSLFFGRWFSQLSYANPYIKSLTEVGFVIVGSIVIVVLVKRATGNWSRYVIGC